MSPAAITSTPLRFECCLRSSLMEETNPTERYFALALCIATLIIYLWAACTPRFRQMIQGVFGHMWAIVFTVLVCIANAVIIYIVVGPFPSLRIAMCVHLASSALWVVFIQEKLLFRHHDDAQSSVSFPLLHFVMQRILLVSTWISSTYICFHIWTSDTHILIAFLCGIWWFVATFDAFIWDILYAKWILKGEDSL